MTASELEQQLLKQAKSHLGILATTEEVCEAIHSPEWKGSGAWTDYVPTELQELWPNLRMSECLVAFIIGQHLLDNRDADFLY
jgi:hypothetical protein